MNKPGPVSPPMHTWQSQVPPANPATLIARIHASSLPLSAGGDDNADILALVAYQDGAISAYVATPSGLIYHLLPQEFEADWWGFALRNYYIVTGNMHDRAQLAERCGVELDLVSGKCISRVKTPTASGLSLEQLFDAACPSLQAGLF